MASNSQKSSQFEPKTSQQLSNSPKKELAESSYIPAENTNNIYIKEYTQIETSESPNKATRSSNYGASPQLVSTSGDQYLTTGYSGGGIGSALSADTRLNPLTSLEFPPSSPFGVPKETNFVSSYEYKSSVTGNPSVNTYDLKTSNTDHIATPYPFPSGSTYTPYQATTTTYTNTYGTTDLKNSSTEKAKQSGLLARDSYPVSRDEQRTGTEGYTILKPLSQSNTAYKQRTTVDSQRYQSTQLGTPFDSVKKTENYLASPPFKRDELEANQADEYLINEPRVSKTTTYTIENPGSLKSPRGSLGAAGSILKTPERRAKSISGITSPLNELKQALKDENVQISKIVIETVENFEGENQLNGSSGKKKFRESLNNRLDIVMEELVPQVFGKTENLLSTEKVKQSHISYETPLIPSYQENATENLLKNSTTKDYLYSSETVPIRSYEYESTYKSTYTPVQEVTKSSYTPIEEVTKSTYSPVQETVVKSQVNDYYTSSYDPAPVKSYTYETTVTNYQTSYGTGQENVYKSPQRDYLSSYETAAANPVTSYAYESTYTSNYKDPYTSLNPLKESIARSESKRVSAAEIGGTISAITERMKNLDDFLERKSSRLNQSSTSSQAGEFRGESDLVTRTWELEASKSGASPKEKKAFFTGATAESPSLRQRLDKTIESPEIKKVASEEEVKKAAPKKDSAFFAKATIAFIVLLLCAILFFEFRMEADEFDNLMDS